MASRCGGGKNVPARSSRDAGSYNVLANGRRRPDEIRAPAVVGSAGPSRAGFSATCAGPVFGPGRPVRDRPAVQGAGVRMPMTVPVRQVARNPAKKALGTERRDLGPALGEKGRTRRRS